MVEASRESRNVDTVYDDVTHKGALLRGHLDASNARLHGDELYESKGKCHMMLSRPDWAASLLILNPPSPPTYRVDINIVLTLTFRPSNLAIF